MGLPVSLMNIAEDVIAYTWGLLCGKEDINWTSVSARYRPRDDHFIIIIIIYSHIRVHVCIFFVFFPRLVSAAQLNFVYCNVFRNLIREDISSPNDTKKMRKYMFALLIKVTIITLEILRYTS